MWYLLTIQYWGSNLGKYGIQTKNNIYQEPVTVLVDFVYYLCNHLMIVMWPKHAMEITVLLYE
jgi:hypothetical protein